MSIPEAEVDYRGVSQLRGIGGTQPVGEDTMCEFTLDCLPDRKFTHSFKPILIPGEPSLVLLGRDFLSKFDETLIDWKNHRLYLGDTWVYYLTDSGDHNTASFDISTHLSTEEHDHVSALLHQYPSVFAHNPKAPRKSNLGLHVINTKSELPHKDKVRRTPQLCRNEVSDQVDQMLSYEIIRPSASPYSSNTLLTKRKDGAKRFCIDFRTLNKNTIKDTYPAPSVEDIIDRFKGCHYFTQVDLASGYWGIPVSPEDIEKTAFATHRGKFECLRMPFGLCNAQATFQRAMDQLTDKVRGKGHNGIDAYVDNIVVYSKTFEEHIATLRCLFFYIEEGNLSLRKDKCEFAKEEIQFLGFIVNGSTVRPTPENVQKVMEFPQPTTRRKLQQFLGMCNFNRKFIPQYSHMVAPLSSLTSSKVKFCWGTEQQHAFNEIKLQLSKAPSLYLADWTREFHIETDASKIAVGAVLFQIDEKGQRLPLGYHSRTLAKSEQGWNTTEQEASRALVSAGLKLW